MEGEGGYPRCLAEPFIRCCTAVSQALVGARSSKGSLSFLHCSCFLTWVWLRGRRRFLSRDRGGGDLIIPAGNSLKRNLGPCPFQKQFWRSFRGLERSSLSFPAVTLLGICPKELKKEKKGLAHSLIYCSQPLRSPAFEIVVSTGMYVVTAW